MKREPKCGSSASLEQGALAGACVQKVMTARHQLKSWKSNQEEDASSQSHVLQTHTGQTIGHNNNNKG